jgi:hypothetical protein
METREEVNEMILKMKYNSRISGLHAYTPEACSFWSFYGSITGFLDNNYFSIYIKLTNNFPTIETTVSKTTHQKRKFKAYLKTVSSYKFINK